MPAYDQTQRQNAYNTIRGAYRTELGRKDDQISDDEIWSHLGGGQAVGQSNIDYALNNIRNSEEAINYRRRPATTTPTPEQPLVNQVATPTTKPAPAAPTTGGSGDSGGRPSGGTPAPAPAFQPPAAAAAPVAAPAASPVSNEATDILRKRLAELSNPIDLQNDANYQAQVRAAQIASLRGADRQRAALAERMAAQGTLRSGGFDTGVQGILENQRETDRGFAAGLAGDRISAREQQLMQAISMARAIGQDGIANQLEMMRLDLQRELGRGDLALRGELGRGQLGLGYDQLGYNYANLGYNMNRDASNIILGGA